MDLPDKRLKAFPEFISEADATMFIDYMNNNIDKFKNYRATSNPNRFALRFGKDQVFWDTSEHTLDKISDIESDVREFFDIVCEETEEAYGLDKKLYVASFWMAKQFPGAMVMPHHDSGYNVNTQFDYSVILYLNKTDGGELTFPELKFTYNPEGRDLIMFPSKGEDMGHSVSNINEERYSILFWLTHDEYFAI